MSSHVQILAQLSEVNVCNKDKQQMEQIYNAGEYMMNILSYVNFVKLCRVIKYFPKLNKILGNKISLFLFHKVQEPING